MKVKTTIAATLAALTLGAGTATAAPWFEYPCNRPVTDIYTSGFTGHSFVSVWTGTDVARGAPGDGVWRLYAVAVDDGTGWRFAYYEWRSCYL